MPSKLSSSKVIFDFTGREEAASARGGAAFSPRRGFAL